MATIKDVADDSGLSISTVSAVLNGADWVPEATRERVLASIETVRYVPNTLARGLKTRRTNAVGVIVTDLTNPFFTEIVRALERTLRKQDHNVFLCNSDHETINGRKNFGALLERRVDGIIIIGSSVPEDLVAQYTEADDHVPIVSVERNYSARGVTRLMVDSEEGGFVATQHLLERGYQRIALIEGADRGAESRTHRRRGYERALAYAGLSAPASYFARGDFRFEGGRDAMNGLLDLPEPPDAVFASNDLMALGALRAARERGIRVPEDLGVVGYDDIPAAGFVDPPLTTIAVPKAELGRSAGELILDQIDQGREYASSMQVFGAELVVRASSAGPAS